MTPEVLQLQPPWLDGHCPREGRYVLGPLLGKGGMGEVVEAWDMVLCRTVALKILRNMEAVSVIRFMHEAQIHARLVHPNICRIYDVDSSEGTVKIAMQLVRGPTLEQASRDLSQAEVVTILARVAEGVHAAHCLKLIHRDLKPSNILLERNVGGYTPYICDFGLAMALDEPALTFTHGILGTPAYMAPEQIRGERGHVGPGTDVYALGGTLYFALLGAPPGGLTPDRDLPQPATAATSMLPPGKAGLPRNLRIIIEKCLEPEPVLRYPTAAALADDLWRFLNGESIQATRLGPLGRFLRLTQRRFRLGLTATLVLAALAAGLGAQALMLERKQSRRAEQAHLFAVEAGEVEKDLRLERMLPIHDLRPAYTRVRARMEQMRSRMELLDPGARGPGHLALARSHYLLWEFPAAVTEAGQAWDGGLRTPEVARLLALAAAAPALFGPDPILGWRQDPALLQPLARVLALLEEAGKGSAQPDELSTALRAFLQKDFGKAAAAAHAHGRLHPWQSEAAYLETASLTALAGQAYASGDLAGAAPRYLEAMAAARRYLPMAQSDEMVHHAYLGAALGLGTLRQDAGALAPADLNEYQRQCQEALRLDGGNPCLQDRWLGLRLLAAARRKDLGQDPGPDLETALVFLGTRAKEPLTPDLRADRMRIYRRMAERALATGGDPGTLLAEALRDGPQAGAFCPEELCEALLLRARLETARGEDPRPTAAEVVSRLEPELARGSRWRPQEVAAEAWLIRGEWEAAHGLPLAPTLQEAQRHVEAALQGHPGSSSAFALGGLARLLELKGDPGRKPLLVMLARERLKLSEALSPVGAQQAVLRRALQNLHGG